MNTPIRVTRPVVGLLILMSLTASCGRDPAPNVKPMSAAPANVTDISEEVIPLDQVSKSQAAVVGQRVATTEIVLTYSRPVARGRQLFGALVPYDQVWTPGADQATAISFTRDVEISGRALPKGSYSLWVIPRADTWTVIFNKVSKAYHLDYPGEQQDALRLQVGPRTGPHVEALTFSFPVVEGKDTMLELDWGEVVVSLPIRVH